MSQYDDDDDFDFEDDGNINSVRKADRAKAKRIKELESKLAAFEAKERTRALANAITEKGLNPKIAAFVPKDLDDAGLDAWLDEYGDVFAAPAPAPAEGDAPAQPAPSAPPGAATFLEVAGTGQAPSDDESATIARLNNVQSMEELMSLLNGTN